MAAVIGVEGRVGPVQYFEQGISNQDLPFLGGLGVFGRLGRWQLGLAGEYQFLDMGQNAWIAPGESQLTSTVAVGAVSLGPSIPGTVMGEGWFWRHVRGDLLGEAGLSFTEVKEDLGGGGPGNRTLSFTTPFVGARLGLRMRLGGELGGSSEWPRSTATT
jgi:hypothetical protein